MTLPRDFLASLQLVPLPELLQMARDGSLPKAWAVLEVRNEILPMDLFCYLGARFGPPNGIQNFLRGDHSGNLVHWEWALRGPQGLVLFQGWTFRTEVLFLGDWRSSPSDVAVLAQMLKDDFAQHGREMSKVRATLENWTEFVNPYQRLRRSIMILRGELESLELPKNEEQLQAFDLRDVSQQHSEWRRISALYSRAFGLCFGVRVMLPVLAECFVNLLMFMFLRTEFRQDARLRESAFRQQIDIRIRSLSVNCHGFARQPKYEHESLKKYQALVLGRNDLLHGNVELEKLQFGDVFFMGRVPVFKRYSSLWDRVLGVHGNAVGLDKLADEARVVDELIEYIRSCLDDRAGRFLDQALGSATLGVKKDDARVGVLFSEILVDVRVRRALDQT